MVEEFPTNAPTLMRSEDVRVADQRRVLDYLEAHHAQDFVVLDPPIEPDARLDRVSQIRRGHVGILPPVVRNHALIGVGGIVYNPPHGVEVRRA